MGVMRTLTINGVKYDVVPCVPATSITLLESSWLGEGDLHYQMVEVPGATAHTKVDLQPTADQLSEFHYLTLAFVAENDGGTVTVYAIGDRPTKDHTIQITKTEVEGVGKIRGNTVGTTMPRANLEQDDPTMADYVFGQDAFLAKSAPAGYGLGTTGQLTNDWNTTVKSGFYYGKTNSPDGGWWAGVVYAEGSGYAFQHLYKNGTNLQKVRECNNGTWGSWIDCGPSAFAPAGFGYGEPLAVYSVETEAELETTLLEILNTMSNYTTKQVRINLGFLGVNTYYLTTIYRHTSVYALVTFQTMRLLGASLLKAYINGTWNAICWENPPMNLGAEYRTTERHNGKVVFAKKFQYTTSSTIGNSSGVTTIDIPHGVDSLTALVRAHSLVGTTAQMPYMEKNSGSTSIIGVDATNVKLQVINTTWGSGRSFTIDIRYTKD